MGAFILAVDYWLWCQNWYLVARSVIAYSPFFLMIFPAGKINQEVKQPYLLAYPYFVFDVYWVPHFKSLTETFWNILNEMTEVLVKVMLSRF